MPPLDKPIEKLALILSSSFRTKMAVTMTSSLLMSNGSVSLINYTDAGVNRRIVRRTFKCGANVVKGLISFFARVEL